MLWRYEQLPLGPSLGITSTTVATDRRGTVFRSRHSTLYMAALRHVEETNIPAVGYSVDRRTLRLLHEERHENNLEALICSCCANVLPTGPGGMIGYLSTQTLFSSLNSESFQTNWSLSAYTNNYGNVAAVRSRQDPKTWHRRLPPNLHDGASILCCAEDIVCKKAARSAAVCGQQGQLCPDCELPVCRSCWLRMRHDDHPGVPQALANDNWVGPPLELLYTERVRWIEAAAACPVWTSMVCFYLEEDKGHLLEEHLHHSAHRVKVRGNVSSFSLPWEDVFIHLQRLQEQSPVEYLPHKVETLAALVKLTIKGARHSKVVDWVKGATVRPWVVTKLLNHLIDLDHPMIAGHSDKDALKAELAARVTREYGTTAFTPAATQEGAAKPQPSTDVDKNAVPRDDSHTHTSTAKPSSG